MQIRQLRAQPDDVKPGSSASHAVKGTKAGAPLVGTGGFVVVEKRLPYLVRAPWRLRVCCGLMHYHDVQTGPNEVASNLRLDEAGIVKFFALNRDP